VAVDGGPVTLPFPSAEDADLDPPGLEETQRDADRRRAEIRRLGVTRYLGE